MTVPLRWKFHSSPLKSAVSQTPARLSTSSGSSVTGSGTGAAGCGAAVSCSSRQPTTPASTNAPTAAAATRPVLQRRREVACSRRWTNRCSACTSSSSVTETSRATVCSELRSLSSMFIGSPPGWSKGSRGHGGRDA
ncbi:hypothetical protein [Ornithinimicrobium kibberense]|uniref:hypothetical protein n=1 Tax=Ornithinimicrobium kibberense TaxID=282060 RepID=UPI0036102C2B